MLKYIRSHKYLKRRLATALLLPLIAFSLLLPSPSQAQGPTLGGLGSDPSLTVQNKRAAKQWHQASSVEDARNFFGANDSEDNLAYRVLVGNDWETPTGPPHSGNTAILDQDADKIRVQVFRKAKGQGPSFATKDQYTDPPAYNHATLTLVAGYHFGEDSKTKAFEDVSSVMKNLNPVTQINNGVSDVATGDVGGLLSEPVTAGWDAVTSPISAVGSLIGGDTQDTAWVFSGNGNPHVTNTLTCSHGSPDGSRFAFLDKEAEAEILSSNGSLDSATLDKYKIADINQTLQGDSIGFKRFDETSLAAYLCQNSNDKDTFAAFCKKMVSDDSRCVTDSRGLLDVLGGLLPSLDPVGWALGLMKTVVSGFIALVSDGLQSIVDISNLADNSGVTAAWKVMRDLANVFFILILGAIAFSTILRLDTKKYNVRALLPRLIFAIIAVNFSLLVVTVLVDFATTLSSPFINRAVNMLTDTNPASNIDAFTGQVSGVGQQMVILVGAIAIAVVLLILLLFFVVRALMIWLLAAFAPLAFLASVLPFSRSLASQWLKQLLKWVFMAPIAFIILWMGAAFLTAANSVGGVLLTALIFIGVCIAAVIIPLKLGGEVMQRATSAGKAAGMKGVRATSTGRAAQAFMKQRQANQDQAAKLQATGWQDKVSSGSPRLGKMLTGADAGQVAVQSAALEDKYAGDMKTLGLSSADQKMIAMGESGKLESRGLLPAAQLAKNVHGQRAAAKLLAQGGHWNDAILDKHKGTGYQAMMKPYDPVMAAVDTQGNISPEALDGIGSYVSYLGPQETKAMYWGQIADHQKKGGRMGQAADKVFASINDASASANVEYGGRNVIADSSDRQAFAEGVADHNTDARVPMAKMILGNVKDKGNTNLHDVGAVKTKMGGAAISEAKTELGKPFDPSIQDFTSP